MQSRPQMMGCVVAVIKDPPVEPPAQEIARVVMVRVGVAAGMLDMVDGKDAPLPVELRKDHVQHRLQRIKNQEYDEGRVQDKPFEDELMIKLGVRGPPRAQFSRFDRSVTHDGR